jgi:hypothetical protein
MDMVVHEAISPNLHLVTLGVFDEPLFVGPAVLCEPAGNNSGTPFADRTFRKAQEKKTVTVTIFCDF